MTEPAFLHTTRAYYDDVAQDYGAKFSAELAGIPFERAMLSLFAELVRDAGGGPVADIGCGPGHLTAHLNTLGLNAFGVDLSPGMLAFARRSYPELRFVDGSMTALDLPDAKLGGLITFYSIIHIPTEHLGEVFRGFLRVLASGGYALLAFQRGDEHRHRSEAFGRRVSIDYYLRLPETVSALLAEAGFDVRAQLLREPNPPEETVPRAFLLARKP